MQHVSFQAVLCPLAIEALIMSDSPVDSQELVYAEDLIRLIVQAILVTTPIGFLLTNYLGPTLLHCDQDRDESSKYELSLNVLNFRFFIIYIIYYLYIS